MTTTHTASSCFCPFFHSEFHFFCLILPFGRAANTLPPAQLLTSTEIVRQIHKAYGRGGPRYSDAPYESRPHRILHEPEHVFNSHAYLRLLPIPLLLPGGQRMIAITLLVNPVPYLPALEPLINILGAVRAVAKQVMVGVILVEEVSKRLRIVKARVAHRVIRDQLALPVNLRVILNTRNNSVRSSSSILNSQIVFSSGTLSLSVRPKKRMNESRSLIANSVRSSAIL